MADFLALKAFPYRGRRLRVGERFAAPPGHGRLFIALGRARPAPAVPSTTASTAIAPVTPQTTAAIEQAEPASTEPLRYEITTERPALDDTPAKRRTYRRRDLRPDE